MMKLSCDSDSLCEESWLMVRNLSIVAAAVLLRMRRQGVKQSLVPDAGNRERPLHTAQPTASLIAVHELVTASLMRLRQSTRRYNRRVIVSVYVDLKSWVGQSGCTATNMDREPIPSVSKI